MDQIYPDTALIPALLAIANMNGGITWHIFTNDRTPALDDDLVDYDLNDLVWPPITLAPADFVNQVINQHVGAIYPASALSWTNLSGVDEVVFGYVITDATGTILLAAARFDDAPKTVRPNGTLSFQAILGSYSGLPS